MIVYVDTKTNKVNLTKEQLDTLLEEKYKEGYEKGKTEGGIHPTIICPWAYTQCYRQPFDYTPYVTTTNTKTVTNSPYCAYDEQTATINGGTKCQN